MTNLSAAQKKFILHWGELGTRWGLNRSVAQIHALLYLSPTPLAAEQLASLLSIARSNVSTSLRELQGWGIVRVVHVMGDRRDHFDTVRDVWEMFTIIVEERKRREIDPTIAVLRECALEIDRNTPDDKEARKRIRQLLAFFEQATTVYDEFRGLPGGVLRQLWKLKGNLKRLFSTAGS
jgi:DNA-binding transcriptional regulator GbsR (MarR family)